MPRVAVAAGSRIAAEAGADVTAAGGNAVDAVLAASIVSLCTDIGIMSPGAGGFVTVWPPDGDPVVIDGYAEMPGRGLDNARFGAAMHEAVFDYGGEMRSLVGWGSIATPGAFAAFACASERYGRIPWARVVEPAARWARRGFPLGRGAAEYLRYTHAAIYSWDPGSYRVLHHADGTPLREGERVEVPDLADSLEQIAREGSAALYGGALGQRIASGVRAAGGLLGIDDLRAYRAIERRPVRVRLKDWSVVTNPPPAVGGACLAAMLALLDAMPGGDDAATATANMVRVQHAVLGFRDRHLNGAGLQLDTRVVQLLELAGLGDPRSLLGAPSTCHASAVDDAGLACAVTASGGYGSGAMVSGTGLWLNNSLGEIDLHPGGLAGVSPGTRLASNMAPTIARRADGAVLAIGSPGASRITTAIAQVLYNHIDRGMSLGEAVACPRLHVEWCGQSGNIAYENGVPALAMLDLELRGFPGPSMYFGGVQAALWRPETGLEAAADARRGGFISI